MGELLTPAFYGFAALVFTTLAGGVGALVKRAWDRESEADDLNAEVLACKEALAAAKVEIVYLKARAEETEERCRVVTWERDQLRGRTP